MSLYQWGTWTIVLWVFGCAPSRMEAVAHVKIITQSSKISGQNYTAQELSDLMSVDMCYAVHVSTPGDPFSNVMFEKRKPEDDAGPQAGCPQQPIGPGLISKTFAPAGGELSLEVPIGPGRRFDLVAVPKSVIGGTCNASLSFGFSSDEGADFLVNGEAKELDKNIVILAQSTLTSIVPGNNEVILSKIVANTSSGIPYLCEHNGGSGGTNNLRVLIPGESNNGIINTSMPEQLFMIACSVHVKFVNLAGANMSTVLNRQMLNAQISAGNYESVCELRPDFGNQRIATFGRIVHVGNFSGKTLQLQGLDAAKVPIGSAKSVTLQPSPAYQPTALAGLDFKAGTKPRFYRFQKYNSAGGTYGALWFGYRDGTDVEFVASAELVAGSSATGTPVGISPLNFDDANDATGSSVLIGTELFRLNSTVSQHAPLANPSSVVWSEANDDFDSAEDVYVLASKGAGLSLYPTSGAYCYARRLLPGLLDSSPTTTEVIDDTMCPFNESELLGMVRAPINDAQQFFYSSGMYVKGYTSVANGAWSVGANLKLASSIPPSMQMGVLDTAIAAFPQKALVMWDQGSKKVATFGIDSSANVANPSCDGDSGTTAIPSCGGNFLPAWSSSGQIKAVKGINFSELPYTNTEVSFSEFNTNEFVAVGNDYEGGVSYGVVYRSPDGGKNWYRVYKSNESSSVVEDVLPVVLDYGLIGTKAYRRVGLALMETAYSSTPSPHSELRVLLQSYTGY